MSAPAATPATDAMALVLAALEGAGIGASRDAGAFYPQPVGVLVGLPALVSRLLAASTFDVPVLIVSGDPLNSIQRVDRLYALADECAEALRESAYRTSSWRSAPNAEPVPALEITVTVTVNGG